MLEDSFAQGRPKFDDHSPARNEPMVRSVAISEEAIVWQLEEEGILSPPEERPVDFVPLAERPGALARFLESRR